MILGTRYTVDMSHTDDGGRIASDTAPTVFLEGGEVVGFIACMEELTDETTELVDRMIEDNDVADERKPEGVTAHYVGGDEAVWVFDRGALLVADETDGTLRSRVEESDLSRCE